MTQPITVKMDYTTFKANGANVGARFISDTVFEVVARETKQIWAYNDGTVTIIFANAA